MKTSLVPLSTLLLMTCMFLMSCGGKDDDDVNACVTCSSGSSCPSGQECQLFRSETGSLVHICAAPEQETIQCAL